MQNDITLVMVLLCAGVCLVMGIVGTVYSLWPKKPLNIKEVYAEHRAKKRTGLLWLVSPLLKPLAARISKMENKHLDKYREKVERELVSAGEPGSLEVDEFMALQLVAGIGTMILGMTLFLLIPKMDMLVRKPHIFLCTSFILFFMGAVLTRTGLADKVKARHREIFRALPFCLDLITISVEAGSDFISAVDRVVERMQSGPLAEELYLMLRQIRMGKTRAEALKAMAYRVNFFHLTSIISALVQADRLGTSLGYILRIQSAELRKRRSYLAEELAMKAPVKMLFPLICFIFPSVFIMLLGPIALAMMKMLPGLMR